ncbi:21428_t:CDS:1, partial [Rhizophagus irregularis]
MHFHRMFKYYGKALKETNATTDEQIREVAEYCIIDAISCQQLMVKCNAINEYREVVSVAFISLYDSHYFAVEMKVRNLLSAVLYRNLENLSDVELIWIRYKFHVIIVSIS